MNGYIKLFRSLLDWEWFDDPNVLKTWIYIISSANYTDTKWQGVEIKRGQLLTSVGGLARELKFSRQEVRTVLRKLEATNEITIKATNKFTLITVEKYAFYQGETFDSNQQSNHQSNQQATTTKESNKYNNINIYSANMEDSANGKKRSGSNVTALFEKLWAKYPNKRGKAQVSETCKRKIYDIGEEHMERAINRYITGLAAEPWRKPQNGSTFFNKGYVDYLDENYQEVKMNRAPEPPRYKPFEKEEEPVNTCPMPDDIRQKMKKLF